MRIKVRHICRILIIIFSICINYSMINYLFFSNLSEREVKESPLPLFLFVEILVLFILLIIYICENWDKTLIDTSIIKSQINKLNKQ